MSVEERRRQLEQLLEEARHTGDPDKVTEVEADLAREFPCSLDGEQHTQK